MARAPRQQAAKQEPAKITYFVLDENAVEMAGRRLPTDDKGERAKTVELTDQEAAFYLASGAISTTDPEKNKRAAQVLAANSGEVVHAGKK